MQLLKELCKCIQMRRLNATKNHLQGSQRASDMHVYDLGSLQIQQRLLPKKLVVVWVGKTWSWEEEQQAKVLAPQEVHYTFGRASNLSDIEPEQKILYKPGLMVSLKGKHTPYRRQQVTLVNPFSKITNIIQNSFPNLSRSFTGQSRLLQAHSIRGRQTTTYFKPYLLKC